MPVRIKKESLVDQIYQHIREDIITLKLPLGGRLNVNELQDQLGVSCTPVREAINRLQLEGLVVYENNIGARILNLNEHDVLEIEELAYALQIAAVRLSMQRGDKSSMALDLKDQVSRYESAKTSRERVKAVHELIGVFYHYCQNDRLDKSMVALQGQILLLRNIYADSHDSGKDSDIFKKMIKGVENGNNEMIYDALLEYSERIQPFILSWLSAHSA